MPSVMTGLLHQLRSAASRPADAGGSDGELLERFLARRDEEAFEAIVRRHGPMVLGVCRRLLRHDHDAEDAFQAAFLVLVRKADSIVPPERIGNWLYGVACRTARKARSLAARRHAKERPVRDMPHPVTESDRADALDLRPHLDRELERLPERYRAPLVLCDLEGKSRSEAARLLRLPEGTLSSRLARARKILRGRLAGRGLALSATSLALALSPQATAAALPAPLLAATTLAAVRLAAGEAVAAVVSAPVATLTRGVLKAMLASKLKGVMVWVLFAALAVLGAGTLGRRALAQPAGPPDSLAREEPGPARQPAAAAKQRTERKEVKKEGQRFTAKDEVTKTFTTKKAPRLIATTFNGPIAVTTGPAGTTKARVVKEAQGSTKEAAEQALKTIDVQITQEGDVVRILARTTGTNRNHRGAALEVEVPPGSQMELKSSNGPVAVTGATGDVTATSTNGGIRVKDSKGKLHLRTTNGPLTVDGGAGRVDLRTTNGPIRIQSAKALVSAQTTNGAIRFSGSLADGKQSFHTTNGSIAIELPADARFRLEAQTTNGRATTSFPLKQTGTKGKGKSRLQGTVGDDPRTVLDLRSTNGRIDVRPAK
jgi:RNA polymerase sigma-70 factor (ECF subfamily)